MSGSPLGSFVQILLTSCITATVAAWLTAFFALKRFLGEKVLERKIAAYTAIFDALHDMHRWFGEHMNALEHGTEVSASVDSDLGRAYNEAYARLKRVLDRERWILPQNCFDCLVKLDAKLCLVHDNWVSMIDSGLAEISSAEDELCWFVRADLGLRERARRSFGLWDAGMSTWLRGD